MEDQTFALETAKFWFNWLKDKVKQLLDDTHDPELSAKQILATTGKFFRDTWPNVIGILKREAEEDMKSRKTTSKCRLAYT